MSVGDALIVVDMQRDFVLPSGSLYVPNAQYRVPGIEDVAHRFSTVATTADWHRFDHPSFVDYGGRWPKHCVMDSTGAEIVVNVPHAQVVRKGMRVEAYSGFDGTCLERLLAGNGVYRLYVCGVATEYCVKATVLDALRLGFEVHIFTNLIAGIGMDSSAAALAEMYSAGAFPAIYEKD